MNELAFGMQVIKCVEEVLQAAFEQRFREASRSVPLEQVLPTIPHRPLDETLMIPAGAVDGKRVHGRSHVPVSRVGRVCLVDELVGLKLVPAGLPMVSGEDFQGNIFVFPSPWCYSA